MPAHHDTGYKLLFSDPLMVRDLLLGFVDDPWLARLDFSTLELVNSHYVSEDLRNRAMTWSGASAPTSAGCTCTC